MASAKAVRPLPLGSSIFDYYAFQTNQSIQRINEEVEFYENCDFDRFPLIVEYVAYLKMRLNGNRAYVYTGPVTIIDKSGNKQEIKKMNMDEYAKDMVTTSFTCVWSKLKPVHKTMKINEFVDGLTYNKKISQKDQLKNKKNIAEQLVEGLGEKRFLKNGSKIEYNPKKMLIESISCVVFNKKKGTYEIDWDL